MLFNQSSLDSVGVGLSAGVGYGLGVLGPHSTAGLKEVLAYAVANNIETQLTEMAKHHQDGLNIRSLLSCVVTTIARQRVGFRLDMLDGPLGQSAEGVQGMLEMLLLDFLGATITGQEVNLKYAVFNSLTSAMMSEVIHAVQADMPSMTPQAKEDKLKGGRNLPPHSKPESQRLGSSQKRYHEKQHQKAILASYGHLPAANDAFFKEPVKEFMSDMRHDVSLDFDADTGHLIFDPLENHLHSSHVRVSTANSGMHSKTTTGQHQQAREYHARARAVPSKSGDSFGGAGLGLFSRPVSSRKPSGFMDYVDGVNSARDSTIGMFKQIVSHPLDTASAPFVGAWNVAHHPKYSYHHAVESTKDFTEHFSNASGAERLGITLGFVGSGIYGAAFGAGVGFGFGKGYSEARGFVDGKFSYEGYRYNMVTNPGPLSKLEGRPALNFSGGKYNKRKLNSDLILSRVGQSGGGRNAWGQWFTSEPTNTLPHARIDLAIKPIWQDEVGNILGKSPIDAYYNLKIPKGAIIYEGPVGYQTGLHLGGQDIMQIYIRKPWELRKAEVLNEVLLNGPR